MPCFFLKSGMIRDTYLVRSSEFTTFYHIPFMLGSGKLYELSEFSKLSIPTLFRKKVFDERCWTEWVPNSQEKDCMVEYIAVSMEYISEFPKTGKKTVYNFRMKFHWRRAASYSSFGKCIHANIQTSAVIIIEFEAKLLIDCYHWISSSKTYQKKVKGLLETPAARFNCLTISINNGSSEWCFQQSTWRVVTSTDNPPLP